ncbi:MAG: 1,2-phenylacetyl-CoA epoxidase subunit B [Bacteroidetes bacterium 46-16]|nr:MAG: 1,2-phenylacetyl-CoA epoxidase subunit B [Bacteroidetes bacterium 46-16]
MTPDTQLGTWEVFMQSKPGANFIHQGSIHAADREMALQNARDTYSRRGEGTSIWVVPTGAITASSPDDKEMLFDPANDKIYRMPTFYTIPEGAKNI